MTSMTHSFVLLFVCYQHDWILDHMSLTGLSSQSRCNDPLYICLPALKADCSPLNKEPCKQRGFQAWYPNLQSHCGRMGDKDNYGRRPLFSSLHHHGLIKMGNRL